ncbi:hypothetical protein [Geothrix oryzae]|uniref:hypothetical protein n=1 Tax=Geothrix oryzae TaxID=2927975 RepID=UPI00257380B9|nr:hypothetical protein [Geothrix oryzae]
MAWPALLLKFLPWIVAGGSTAADMYKTKKASDVESLKFKVTQLENENYQLKTSTDEQIKAAAMYRLLFLLSIITNVITVIYFIKKH